MNGYGSRTGLRPTMGRPIPETASTGSVPRRVPATPSSTSLTTRRTNPCGRSRAGQVGAAARTRARTSLSVHIQGRGNRRSPSGYPGTISSPSVARAGMSLRSLSFENRSATLSRSSRARFMGIGSRRDSAERRTVPASRSPLSFGADGYKSSDTLRSTAKYPSGALRAGRFHRSSARRSAVAR